jgi:hypothetical protein
MLKLVYSKCTKLSLSILILYIIYIFDMLYKCTGTLFSMIDHEITPPLSSLSSNLCDEIEVSKLMPWDEEKR